MSFNLHVEDFGKIKKADIEVKPLTLFVGDNNSGKSYLLSLIWGLRNSDCINMIFQHSKEYLKLPLSVKIESLISDIFDKKNEDTISSSEFIVTSAEFVAFFNEVLKLEKKYFINIIFNSEKIKIGKLSLSICNQREIKFKLLKNASGNLSVEYDYGSIFFSENFNFNNYKDVAVREILLSIVRCYLNNSKNNIYLPAARTGFVLSKNILNQYGRSIAFTMYQDKMKADKSSYFTKPIVDFLDKLEANAVGGTKYKNIIDFIEREMSNGKIEYINENSKEISYIPNGMNEKFPLMITSALVTELTPLILLLKNHLFINTICYEEPEMCLHPKYQAIMARVLIQLVNKKIDIIATTHSDIILQHINNMCILAGLDKEKREKIFAKYGLYKTDLIKFDNVNVYQMRVDNNQTVVAQIIPEKYGFDVHTFTDALENILTQSMYINKSMVGNDNVC